MLERPARTSLGSSLSVSQWDQLKIYKVGMKLNS